MRRLLPMLAVSSFLLLPSGGEAWNKPGHRTVAAVAYLNLSENTKARVDALLRRHPDFTTLARGLSEEDPNFGMFVFMRAAEWPDLLRDDPRFFNDGGEPTPQLPGFPDMMRHQSWHFIDQGFSTDGTQTRTGTGPGALSQLIAFQGTLGDPALPEATRAYNLSWLLHLAGDIHQPLHSISRFSSRHRNGDRGGNSFSLASRDRNLHSFWDGALTPEEEDEALVSLAEELIDEIRRDPGDVGLASDPAVSIQRWADESIALTKYVVYTVGDEDSSPVRVRRAYRRLASQIARHRAVVAGYRIAELLNHRLP